MLGWEPAADHPKVTDAAGLAQVELVELIHKGLFFPRNPSETSQYRPYTGLSLPRATLGAVVEERHQCRGLDGQDVVMPSSSKLKETSNI